MRILVTGGCGFIGSNFIKYILTSNEIKEKHDIINIDKQTYAGQGKNIEQMGLDKKINYDHFKIDVCNKDFIEKIFSEYKPQAAFNFAAESHVDKSFEDFMHFADTNILGTLTMLETARKHSIEKFIHISTDEVYGSIRKGSFKENDGLNPTNPYSISKAAADWYAQVFYKTHGLPILITRSANNYGPYQFPEKILPLFITNLLEGKKVPLMYSEENPGLNVRDWLHVEDNCRAIWHVFLQGKPGEIYNIPGNNEMTNLDLAKLLLYEMDYGDDMIEKIPHRKAHDFRYSINGDKLKSLNFKYKHTKETFKNDLISTILWYKTNKKWWRSLKYKQRKIR